MRIERVRSHKRRPGRSAGAAIWPKRLLALAALATGCAWAGESAQAPHALVRSYASFTVAAPPAALGLDPFYAKHVDAGGIPVVSSARVSDDALLIARDIVDAMLAHRPDVRVDMVGRGVRVGVMAIDEGTMDLPEQRDWKKPAKDDPRLTFCERKNYARIAAMTDAQYWNGRARGMGGDYTTVGEENLLGVAGSRYFGESILVHEFSHNILSTLQRIEPDFHREVEAAYGQAMRKGLWADSYAMTTVQEYWAEGTQFWFDSNMAYANGASTIADDQDLARYDPVLHRLLGRVYGDTHRIPADVFHMSPARLLVHPVGSGGC